MIVSTWYFIQPSHKAPRSPRRRGQKSISPTQHGELGHSATALVHFADVDGVVIGGDIPDGEAAQGPLLLYAILGVLLQARLLHEPVGLRGRGGHLTHQGGRVLLLHFHILQLPPERDLRLWYQGSRGLCVRQGL